MTTEEILEQITSKRGTEDWYKYELNVFKLAEFLATLTNKE